VSGLFYNLGRIVGPHFRKARWAWLSATGTQTQAIEAEYEAGKDLALQIRHQLILDSHPRTAQLLNEIGARLNSAAV
jgi:hypothetical protein